MGIENRRANFKYRTTLIQKRSSADENHGWCLVEVIKRFMEMDEQYGRLPEVDFYAVGSWLRGAAGNCARSRPLPPEFPRPSYNVLDTT